MPMNGDQLHSVHWMESCTTVQSNKGDLSLLGEDHPQDTCLSEKGICSTKCIVATISLLVEDVCVLWLHLHRKTLQDEQKTCLRGAEEGGTLLIQGVLFSRRS